MSITTQVRLINTFGPILQPNIRIPFGVPCAVPVGSIICGRRSSVGRACGEFLALKGKNGQKFLNFLGPSPVQLRKNLF